MPFTGQNHLLAIKTAFLSLAVVAKQSKVFKLQVQILLEKCDCDGEIVYKKQLYHLKF